MDLQPLYDRARDLLTGEATGDLFLEEHLPLLEPLMKKVAGYQPPAHPAWCIETVMRRRDRTTIMAVFVGAVFGTKAIFETEHVPMSGQPLSARRSLLFALIWAQQKITIEGHLLALNTLTKNILRWVLVNGDLKTSQKPEHISLRGDDDITPISSSDFETADRAI